MKTILRIFALMLIVVSPLYAQEKSTITVEIENLKNDNGQLLVGLYNSKDRFLVDVYKGEAVKITNGKATVAFKDVPVGSYALSCFHDENSNNKMDTNFMGIPKEDYGTSNDAKGFMGPPKWEDAVVTLTAQPLTVPIRL